MNFISLKEVIRPQSGTIRFHVATQALNIDMTNYVHQHARLIESKTCSADAANICMLRIEFFMISIIAWFVF